MTTDVIVARIDASPGRRLFGLGVLIALGAMVIWLGLTQPGGALVWRAGLILLGAAVLLAARSMHRATALTLLLSDTELRASDGALLAHVDDIAGVDRGTFAFKPSNGFLIKLKTPAPRAWRPGLYWRFGRRIGVGGVAHASQSKAMADALTIMLVERNVRENADEG
ncbi:MAG: hypothetical protein ACRBBU_01800 [Pseudooceanicola sp.]